MNYAVHHKSMHGKRGLYHMKLKKAVVILMAIFFMGMSGITAMADAEGGISASSMEIEEDGSMLSIEDNETENLEETDGINSKDAVIDKESVDTENNKESTDMEETEEGSKEVPDNKTSDKEEAPKKEEPVVKEQTVKNEAAAKEKKPAYSEAELRLLSALIYCEAQGEPYAGKLAVGIVVVNRKKSASFPNTIKGVIYQKSQFSPVKNGGLAKALDKYDKGLFTDTAQKECIKAAKEALNGTVKITYKDKTYNLKGYYFFNGRVRKYKLQIANHQFK